jgi:hypothetical protein
MTVFGGKDPTMFVSSADKPGSVPPDARITVIEGGGLGLN